MKKIFDNFLNAADAAARLTVTWKIRRTDNRPSAPGKFVFSLKQLQIY